MAITFVDEARIFVSAGDGGRGCVSYEPVMGSPHKRRPSGGTGGKGGCVYFQADHNLQTLLDFKYQQHHRAKHGSHGGSANKTGADAADLILRVPIGTVVTIDEPVNNLMGVIRSDSVDILSTDEKFLLLQGGQGGKGNQGSKRLAEEDHMSAMPEQREGVWVKLELKLVADIGFVGFPNAGKSSLVRAITGAKPEVGAYPFTTLYPVLGMLHHPDETETIDAIKVADIPGLIEGAHQGIGLGSQFLRHISRVTGIGICIDGSLPVDVLSKQWNILQSELAAYDEKLLQKPQLLILTKNDLWETIFATTPIKGVTFVGVSAQEKNGLDELARKLFELVKNGG